MGVISEVKCSRCDRRYSGFRGRCPYCGARRSKRGKRAEDTENAKAKLIIGVILLVVLIGATMVLIFTNIPESPSDAVETPSGGGLIDDGPALPDDSDIDEVISTDDPGDNIEESPSPPPSPEIVIQEVIITYGGEKKEDVTLKVGESLPFRFKTVPEVEGKEATWESSDESVFMVVNGKVTGVGAGKATLRCIVDGVTGECIVRVRAAR
jgi:hypothetical protein